MARSIEIELKFEVLDWTGLKCFLENLKILEQKRIVDTYLDTESASLFERGIFMRIRNHQKFDIKFNAEDVSKDLNAKIEHTHCDEVSIPLPFTKTSMPIVNETLASLDLAPMTEPTLENIIRSNNLVESMTIDKQRTSYESGEFRIDIDTVKDLGEFLEIEKMTDEHADQNKVIQAMKDHVKELELRYVDIGYNELYWRQHNFDLYLKGKYLLAEDRKRYRPQTLQA